MGSCLCFQLVCGSLQAAYRSSIRKPDDSEPSLDGIMMRQNAERDHCTEFVLRSDTFSERKRSRGFGGQGLCFSYGVQLGGQAPLDKVCISDSLIAGNAAVHKMLYRAYRIARDRISLPAERLRRRPTLPEQVARSIKRTYLQITLNAYARVRFQKRSRGLLQTSASSAMS